MNFNEGTGASNTRTSKPFRTGKEPEDLISKRAFANPAHVIDDNKSSLDKKLLKGQSVFNDLTKKCTILFPLCCENT